MQSIALKRNPMNNGVPAQLSGRLKRQYLETTMEQRTFKLGGIAAAVATAVLHMGGASAQQAAPAAPASDGLNMERVVVTGTSGGSTKMKSSVSIRTLEGETIKNGAPLSAAEVLRSVPGVRSESSGGEGNANITVRGVPISAGGARYVQIQEDGLPVLQLGDFNFITPDSYVKIDGTLDHLEVVRGGSASTLATNAPGGIVNFITKTGEEKGGHIRVSHRSGEGVRNTGLSTESGGQIRGNITHELDNGFIRLSFKHLDDQSPTALPVPVQVVNQQIQEIPGIDPRKVTFYSPYWVRDVTLGKNNTAVSTNVNDGLKVKSDTLGLEGSFGLGDGWNVSDKFRTASNSGRFTGVFAADNGTVGNYTYATGPSKGLPYNGRAFSAVVFNTSIDDAGNTLNDTKLAKTFKLAGGSSLTTTAGLYLSTQKLALTWNFNEYLMQASGDKPALLQTASATPGLVGPAFGGCCSRAVDMEYKLTSPYLNVGYETGPLNIDASVRQDRQRASGTANIATMSGGALRYDPATQQLVDYKINHNSYSVGGNYRVTGNLAAFARVSDGVAFNADRILFGTPLDGSAPININTVKQIEGGVKWRSGGVSTFVTLFQAKTDESNYEATTQRSTSNKYDAKGVELEGAYALNDFRVTVGMTYTDAKITGTAPGDVAVIGNTPRRQAKVVYQIAPTYTFGQATVGASVIGTGKSWGDDAHTIVLPAYQVVNAFVNYHVTEKATLSLSVNNLLNKIGYTEVEGDGHAARSISDRAAKVSLSYAF